MSLDVANNREFTAKRGLALRVGLGGVPKEHLRVTMTVALIDIGAMLNADISRGGVHAGVGDDYLVDVAANRRENLRHVLGAVIRD